MSETPTLFEWAGGRDAIARMIGCFYDRVEHDDLISPMFPGGVTAAHREHVTTWWCEVFGGPAGYTERLGGYPAMLDHHRNLGITADQRFRFASLMSLAADDADLPADPSFCRHGNPNVLTADRGSSRLAQGCAGQLALVEVERYHGEPPPVRAWEPPPLRRAGAPAAAPADVP